MDAKKGLAQACTRRWVRTRVYRPDVSLGWRSRIVGLLRNVPQGHQRRKFAVPFPFHSSPSTSKRYVLIKVAHIW
jgi:cytochrome c-type biogenesis protein CcmH/NrfG